MRQNAAVAIRSLALVLVASLLSGCPIAPKEIDTTVTLGRDEVKYRTTLRELKVQPGGPALTFPLLSNLWQPPADLIREIPWMSPPASYQWRLSDAGVVELEFAGTMPRAVFERCAVAGCSDAGVKCESFPFEACNGAYRLNNRGWERVGNTPEKWSLDAGTLAFRVLNDEETGRDGVSAAAVFAVYARAPEASAKTAQWITDYTSAHERADLGAVKKLLLAPVAASPELLAVVDDAVRSARQRLLYELISGSEADTALPSPPESWTTPYRALAPKKLPGAAAWKLRVAYDVAHLGFTKSGALAENLPVVEVACREKGLSATVCGLLLVKR